MNLRNQEITLKHSIYVVGQTEDEPDVELFIRQNQIVNSTIVMLGNYLAAHSFKLPWLATWQAKVTNVLSATGCNLILLRGDVDNPSTLDYFYNSYIRGISKPTVIGGVMFLPGGLTSSYEILRHMPPEELIASGFLLYPERIIGHRINTVVSIIPPQPELSDLQYIAIVEEYKQKELTDMQLAKELISAYNNVYDWYYCGTTELRRHNKQITGIPEEALLKIR